ncbi:nickel-dependent hydrogenase large subunit [Xanthobacter sp. ZOL 2024]
MTAPRASLQRLTITRAPKGDGWRFVRAEGPDPARVLEGRAVAEAARLAPRIFNLCGAAHGFAAARALGLLAEADADAMMRESRRDHALAILHTWPSLCGGAPDRAALATLAQPGGAATGGAPAGGGPALAGALVGERRATEDFTAQSVAALNRWLAAGPTATARILARLRRLDPACGRAGLPELGRVDLERALLGDLQPPPHARGATPPEPAPFPLRETGALGRVGATPLFAELLAAEGPSLFVRLLARLADLLSLGAVMPGISDAPLVPFGATRADRSAGQSTLSLGHAEAARGLLGHGAQVVAGRVADYRILSPSTWNLAPGGLLEQAFARLAPGPDTAFVAGFLISAINPCVPVTLDLQGALADA